jgi:hypothetical protein
MLARFDQRILTILENLSEPYSELKEDTFCKKLRAPGALQTRRETALMTISWELQRAYKRPVVVLIDEYDTPMHWAMEYGFASEVRSFILLYCS